MLTTLVLQGSIAYVPQEAWIQNATVRDNILFGKTMSRRRYDQVVQACALESDFKILIGGDMTEIGEKVTVGNSDNALFAIRRTIFFFFNIFFVCVFFFWGGHTGVRTKMNARRTCQILLF